MGRDSGFTRPISNMVKLQDIGGMVHPGRSMVLMKDLLKRLPVIQSLLCTKKQKLLVEIKSQGFFPFVVTYRNNSSSFEIFLCKYTKYVKKLTQRVSSTSINTITCSRFWFIKTMFFKLTRMRLIVPCRRTPWRRWIKIPKSIFRRMISPTIYILLC
jgi:hypothetical protein